MRGPKNEKQLSSLSTGYRAKKEANDLVVCSLVKKRHFSGLGFRFQPREEEEEVFVFFLFRLFNVGRLMKKKIYLDRIKQLIKNK